MNEINKNMKETNKTDELVGTKDKGETSMDVSDFKVITDAVKTLREQYDEVKKTVKSFVTDKCGLDESIILHILKYETSKIRETDVNELRFFLEDHSIVDDDRYDSFDDESIYELVENIKNSSIMLDNLQKGYDEIINESNEVMADYLNYMNSNKIQETFIKRIEAMKTAAELETDSYKKSKIYKMISALEVCQSYTFLQERFEKCPKEASDIVAGYFDTKKGSYIIEKFKTKIHTFGYKPSIFNFFFNIEENFLEEKYQVFNNLFLFIYMRIVAYANPYDKRDEMIVKTLTGSFTNLIYHKFENGEKENEFLVAIRGVLDHFDEYYERFNDENSTHPKHPQRVAADIKRENARKTDYINTMKKLNITGYDEEWTADELMEFMNEEIERMRELQRSNLEEVDDKESEEVPDIVQADFNMMNDEKEEGKLVENTLSIPTEIKADETE